MAAGFDTDIEPREPNAWEDVWPDGLARLKGLWVPNADTDTDGDTDERVAFSVVEYWTFEQPDVSHLEEEGFWLKRYSYNGYCTEPYATTQDGREEGRGNHRHDFHEGHPDLYHLHPFGEVDDDVRRGEDPVSLEDALTEFLGLIDDLVAHGIL